MKNKISLAAILLLVLVIAGTAVAQLGPPNRTEFYWVQTYVGWGPATYYGQTVTVVYEGDNRWKWNPKNHHFNLRIQGTATVYAGTTIAGNPIYIQPFINIENWIDGGNTWGWPGRWYDCEVQVANYYWNIPGVYHYYVTKHGNTWS